MPLLLGTSTRVSCAISALVLSIIGFLLVGARPVLIAVIALAVITPVLAVIDVRERRLPNVVTLPFLGIALLAATVDGLLRPTGARAEALLVTPLAPQWLLPLGAALAAAIVFGVLSLVGGTGMGDTKLAIGLAALLASIRWTSPLEAMVIAMLIGGIAGVIGLVMKKWRMRSRIPFGPCLLAGAWLALAAGTIGAAA